MAESETQVAPGLPDYLLNPNAVLGDESAVWWVWTDFANSCCGIFRVETTFYFVLLVNSSLLWNLLLSISATDMSYFPSKRRANSCRCLGDTAKHQTTPTPARSMKQVCLTRLWNSYLSYPTEHQIPNIVYVDNFTAKTKSHEAASLPNLVENLVKNWEIEASFKTSIDDWRTIDRPNYTFAINVRETAFFTVYFFLRSSPKANLFPKITHLSIQSNSTHLFFGSHTNHSNDTGRSITISRTYVESGHL